MTNSTDKIYLGTITGYGSIYLSKHSWDCNWYWGFGYLGNNNLHFYIESLIEYRYIKDSFLRFNKEVTNQNKTGKRRYPLYYREVLNQVTYQLCIVIENTLVIFGYWYKDQFYTTHKEIKEYSNTNKLHKLKLIQTEWDKMPRGFYYRSNLKPYFID